jgi:hypothetical protein
MIAVGVGVDHGRDPLGGGRGIAQGGQHLGRQVQVEQCVDEQ